MGSDGPGGWDPSLQVAGGDTLLLRFAAPVTAVMLTSTTNHDASIQPPSAAAIPGQAPSLAAPGAGGTVLPAIVSELFFGPTGASATDDPQQWAVTLPTDFPRWFQQSEGGTFAIVATVDGTSRAYALRLDAPRMENYGSGNADTCGQRYVWGTSGWQNASCEVFAHPGLGPSPDPVAPPPVAVKHAKAVSIAIKRLRRARLGVQFTLTSTAAGALRVRASLAGRRYKTDRTIRTGKRTMTVRLPAKARGRLSLRVRLVTTTATATARATARLR